MVLIEDGATYGERHYDAVVAVLLWDSDNDIRLVQLSTYHYLVLRIQARAQDL